MSLTSYRAAPPRVRRLLDVQGEEGGGSGRPGDDLLSRVLRRSTIGAEGFHGRVRDGIGCIAPRHDHQVIRASLREGGDEALCRVLRACMSSGRCMRWLDQADGAISTG